MPKTSPMSCIPPLSIAPQSRPRAVFSFKLLAILSFTVLWWWARRTASVAPLLSCKGKAISSFSQVRCHLFVSACCAFAVFGRLIGWGSGAVYLCQYYRQNFLAKSLGLYCIAKEPLLARYIASLATQYSLFWRVKWAELKCSFC